MKSFKRKLKIGLLAARNNFNEYLAYEENEEFDQKIGYFARCLTDNQMLTFFHLFRCVETYESICEKVNRVTGKNNKVGAFEKQSTRIKKKLVEKINMEGGKSLSGWIDHRRKWKPK